MELVHVLETQGGPAEPIIAVRHPAFLADKHFVARVPPRVRAVFASRGDDAWGKLAEARKQWLRMPGLIQYAPSFKAFEVDDTESLDKIPAQDLAAKVKLLGMDEARGCACCVRGGGRGVVPLCVLGARGWRP